MGIKLVPVPKPVKNAAALLGVGFVAGTVSTFVYLGTRKPVRKYVIDRLSEVINEAIYKK